MHIPISFYLKYIFENKIGEWKIYNKNSIQYYKSNFVILYSWMRIGYIYHTQINLEIK